MTAGADSGVSGLQARFGRALASRLGPHIERLHWSAQQLADYQCQQLRALLATALGRSQFHARRLAGTVLVTNLHNHTQPLIRYELTDHFTRRPGGGDPYLRATVEGRADEAFRYRDVTVDPLVIRTVMVRTANAVEYQVRQTSRGVDVAVVADGPIDRADLASSLERSLRTAGLPTPCVQVREVAEIGRNPQTGKTRRFIPL